MSPQFDWRLLAEPHKPADPTQVNVTIRGLRANGWTARDIAKTLRVDVAVVLEALRQGASASTCAD